MLQFLWKLILSIHYFCPITHKCYPGVHFQRILAFLRYIRSIWSSFSLKLLGTHSNREILLLHWQLLNYIQIQVPDMDIFISGGMLPPIQRLSFYVLLNFPCNWRSSVQNPYVEKWFSWLFLLWDWKSQSHYSCILLMFTRWKWHKMKDGKPV